MAMIYVFAGKCECFSFRGRKIWIVVFFKRFVKEKRFSLPTTHPFCSVGKGSCKFSLTYTMTSVLYLMIR